jgi:sarcosine oxidase delta subunit
MIVLLGVDKPNETFMTLECPICKSSVQELPRAGDATGYHCATHGDFKVADTVFAEAEAKGYTREQWEAAPEKAEERTDDDEWAFDNNR